MLMEETLIDILGCFEMIGHQGPGGILSHLVAEAIDDG